MNWMKDVDTFLMAEDAAVGDVNTLEAQLEQSNVRIIFCETKIIYINYLNITLTNSGLLINWY